MSKSRQQYPSKAESDQIKRINDAAEERAKKIVLIVNKITKLVYDEDITLNDFEVIATEVSQRIRNVILGQQVKDFIDLEVLNKNLGIGEAVEPPKE